MHVVDIADPANPSVLFIHEFTKGEGVPRSIDICGNEIAVAMAAQTDVNEGHVRYFQTYTRGSGATDITYDKSITGAVNSSFLYQFLLFIELVFFFLKLDVCMRF
jgi:hypothetical protein